MNYEELMERYPNLYADKNASMQETCMCWGIECGDGWYTIIDRLSSALESLILELPEEEQKYYRAAQVKEKFGTLRFYMTAETVEMTHAIQHAMDLSEVTCEICGEPGELRSGGWIMCRCDACEEERTKK